MSDAAAFSRPQTTIAVTKGAARLVAALGWAPVFEVPLPNGRRADIMAVSPRGEFMIVEVKSSPADYLYDHKWAEYAPWCDRFYFAVAPEFPREILAEGPGLIVADAFGGAVLTESPVTPLAPARRRSLILGFARLAAMRAAGLPEPAVVG